MIHFHTLRFGPRVFLAIITAVLLAGTVSSRKATTFAQGAGSLPIPRGTPAALVKSLVVENREVSETNELKTQATITRGAQNSRITLPLFLYEGDLIETFADTKVTVLFLDDPVPGRDNEVIIYPNSKVGICSSDSWWGRAWAKVKDAFTSETRYARLSAPGTEYEVNVIKDQPRAILTVIEGTVKVEEGKGTLTNCSASPSPTPTPETEAMTTWSHQFLLTNFLLPTTQTQFGRELEVTAGQVLSQPFTYNVYSECHQPHRYEFRTSDGTPWFSLVGDKNFVAAPKDTAHEERTVQIDATRLAPGSYQAHVYAICLDCRNERGCSQAQLEWPYRITVGPPPSQENKNFLVDERKQLTINQQNDQVIDAPTSDLQFVVNWTGDVLITTQPTYSAQNLIPHFTTQAERNQNFRTARERVVLSNKIDSQETLGDVYNDWGQPAWALYAYEKQVSRPGVTVQPPNLFIDRGEALRLTGQLDEAAKLSLSAIDINSAKAQNLFGNIALDRARIALNGGDTGAANSRVEEAKKYYTSALSVPTAAQAPAGAEKNTSTVRTNLAEASIVAGDLALQSNSPQGAKDRFTEAAQQLESIQQASSIYPFPTTDLGVAYRGLGDAAVLSGDVKAASESYAKARRQHEQALAAHRDFAEAYFNLGDLFDDLGDRENAKANYRLAIQFRPEQPASYYPLAMLVKDEDPALAAALAAVYLKLERRVFLRGPKAENAQKLADGKPVIRPPRIGEPIGGEVVTVPNLVNLTQRDALNAIKAAGFIAGTLVSRTDSHSKDIVLEQKPTGGARAPRGSAIDLVVSAGAETGVPVPNVLNLSQTEAKAAIENVGLKVGNVVKRNDTKAEGTVLEQTPTAGTSAPRGSAINLVVASAEQPVVPNVVGMSQTEATTAIESAGLKVRKIQTRSENNKPKNTVIKQSPNAGKTVKQGSSVDLVVSEGVDVPGVINNSRDKATREITRRGLRVGKIEERGSCKVGDVIEQNPAPHTKADPDTPVDLVIGALGENPVRVPNLIGRSRDEAIAAIRDRELTLGRVGTQVSDAPEGTVVRQSPQPETQFARNCPFTIDLTVAIPHTVGNYVGSSERAARLQISLDGFSPSVEYRETSDQRDGIVLEQDPQPGTRAAGGSVVRLVVSRVPRVPVPNVVGMFLSNAKATLENAQLNLGQVTYEKPSPAPVGTTFGFPANTCKVTRQDPVGGRQVPRGTPVNLWVIEWLDGNQRRLDCRNYGNGGNLSNDGNH
jgi:beta-lactam-binding protein with PASTA domain/tetratricopeptide (TPR) repeat protein